MRRVTVIYHHEGNSWWAESNDLPGFSAAADTREELDALVREGVNFHFDGEPHVLVEAEGWDVWEAAVVGVHNPVTTATPPRVNILVETFAFHANTDPAVAKAHR